MGGKLIDHNKYYKMKKRLQNSKIQEALEYFENRRKEREERRKRLDFLGISRIEKKGKYGYGISRKKDAMIWIIQQLGAKCRKCGYKGTALSIHHKNGRCGIKIRRAYEYIKWFKEKQIPDDIELLCANCHMELTWKTRNVLFDSHTT